MTIKIDFDNKLIIIEETITLQKLFDNLRSLNIDFKEYKLVVDTKYVEIPIWNHPYYNGYPRWDFTVPQIDPQVYPIIVSQVSF